MDVIPQETKPKNTARLTYQIYGGKGGAVHLKRVKNSIGQEMKKERARDRLREKLKRKRKRND